MFFQYGDIILVHGDNLISEAIQDLTRSFFSHAALCTDPGKIAEMTRYGFRYWDNHYVSGSRPYVILRHRRLFPPSPVRLYYLNRMRGCIETFRKQPPKYDYFEILCQALKLILSKGSHPARGGDQFVSINLLMAISEKLICSALVDSVYERSGIDLFPGRASKHTTPADISSLSTGDNPALLVIYKNLQ